MRVAAGDNPRKTVLEPSTHSFVASLPCGCGVAICLDEVDYPKDTAASVASFIKDGYQVDRMEHPQAVEAFQRQCENYPHEDWQKRNEAASLKGRSKLPLEVA